MKPKHPDSQKKAVLRALRRRAGLSVADAFLLGCTHLPSVIMKLRRGGHLIDAQWHSAINRFGRPVRFKKYSISN